MRSGSAGQAEGFLTLAGAGALLLTIWLGLGWPIGLRHWLDVGETPAPADAIVCLGGGTSTGNLPIDRGWERIATAAEIYADGYAPLLVFSGSGWHGMSEGEVYADAAAWLGVPRSAIVIDMHSPTTADHPRALMRLAMPNGPTLTRDSPLLLVTSWFHARRALLVFRRAGFRNVRVVTSYVASLPRGTIGRHRRASAITEYVPSTRQYDDFFLNASYGFRDLFTVVREVVALGWYRQRGWI